MSNDRRHLWVWACLGLAILLPGCATRGSVQRLSADVATLRARVDATNREVAQLTTVLKESETRLGEQARGLESVGQRVERLERLDAKLQEFDKTLKDVKASVDALRAPPPRAERPPLDSAERIYASAQSHYQAGNFGQAVLEFLDIAQNFPKHPLAENAQYWIAGAYMAQRDYRQAQIEFRKVLDLYPGGRKTPDALYQLGLAYKHLLEPQRAREAWQQVMRRFPDSDAARLARGAVRSLPAARRGK